MEGGGRACNVCVTIRLDDFDFGFIDVLWALFFLWIEIVKTRWINQNIKFKRLELFEKDDRNRLLNV